jgi:hypothetical protein
MTSLVPDFRLLAGSLFGFFATVVDFEVDIHFLLYGVPGTADGPTSRRDDSARLQIVRLRSPDIQQ